MEPSAAVQVTDLLVTVPATVAVNCSAPLVVMEVELGETLTEVTTGVETVTVAVADLVASATLVAVTVSVPAVAGAVYSPAVVMVPSAAFQVTDLFVTVPATVALNCTVPLVIVEAGDGET